LADAAARGIPVGNTPHVLDGATADMGMTLLLASARRVVEGDRYARSMQFTRHDPGYMLGNEVHGMTLGIVGLGNIGRQVARRARAFDMTVLYYNRRRREEAERELGVEYATFEGLLQRSDYVMLCCPLTEETRNLINAAALGKMKPTATLVNVARGGVVDTQALYEALRDGRIARASLDVSEPEPLPRDHPILKLDNLTIVPHLGSATVETRRKMAENSVINLMRGLRGEPLLFEVRL
jgi:glyoxylate reductase